MLLFFSTELSSVCLEQTGSIGHKGRVNTQLGMGPNYFGVNHFSYRMVLDTGTNPKYTIKSDLTPNTMKLHQVLFLGIIDSLIRTYTR